MIAYDEPLITINFQVELIIGLKDIRVKVIEIH